MAKLMVLGKALYDAMYLPFAFNGAWNPARRPATCEQYDESAAVFAAALGLTSAEAIQRLNAAAGLAEHAPQAGEPADKHNAMTTRILREMWQAADGQVSHVSVMAESLLLGAAMLWFPGDPRRQAQMIQEIADAAQERAKVVRP